ncbi:MerR family transcriptional regulator [Streptomonospora nanhaiensis]|uniref:DNA-binding transcriptional MerR regulator n=1 Tax=Streptomonospora nanhaiensis TaxID=1323731 RepID=A0A853BGG5_9ACTN|nr:MerR family transcriptional regulator [Streptomonospora nanhaiensis]MBV2366366.1 MerR family transcriptional regulator [Streptomonospora nanhaiensis]MBX9387539.1 MerR family transcriptional regulator [Streptomonospora nanhaiensis]NYI94120.1 DNA-binding transcriptional MerR regulator [Streptomonospora nanhaiensis]
MHTPAADLLTIGEAAARTGLTVKAVRFYADEGIVPETARSAAGYRLYDAAATARLDLVRTLRELGIDLPTVRAVLRRDADLGEVAAAHVESLDAQIRVLRLRRAVLRTVAHRTPTEREITLMTDLARLSAEERQRIIDDYHDAVFGGLDMDEEFVARQRSVRVDLPDDPAPEQVDAWVELAGLVRDPAFRDRVRRMSTAHARARAEGTYQRPGRDGTALAERVAAEAGAARAAGLDPAGAEARPVVDGLAAAALHGRPDTPEERRRLADELDLFVDARVERYWQLVGVINGWAPIESRVPDWEWFLAGLRATGR